MRDFIASTSRGAIKYVFRLGFFVVAVAVAAAVFHIQASCIFFCFHQHSPLNVSSFRTNSKLSSLPACTRVFFSPFSRGQSSIDEHTLMSLLPAFVHNVCSMYA